jgi:hypothetical protein
MRTLGFTIRPGHRLYLGFLGLKLYMERPRWRSSLKALQNLKSQPTNFEEYICLTTTIFGPIFGPSSVHNDTIK